MRKESKREAKQRKASEQGQKKESKIANVTINIGQTLRNCFRRGHKVKGLVYMNGMRRGRKGERVQE